MGDTSNEGPPFLLLINFLYCLAMRVKIKLNSVPIDMIEPVRAELRDLGYDILSLDDNPQITVEKDAETIRLHEEMYGFNELFGIADIEYLN